MAITLEETSWEITDDTTWTKDWVGLSSGDIYRDKEPFGHYVAAWYPNTDRPMQMIVTVLDARLRPTLSIGIHCPRGQLEALVAVEPTDIPWESDGAMFGPVASPREFETYTAAREALLVVPDIVMLDRSLYKYVCEPEMPIAEPKEYEPEE